MTYTELKIALDIRDPNDVLSSIASSYDVMCSPYFGYYFIVCDDGDAHCFDENGKEHDIDYIPDNCFINRFFKKIIIPEIVMSIGDRAFLCCMDITCVTIPDIVTSIGEGAFRGCRSLKNVTVPDSVIYIGYGAFEFCSSLRDVTVSSNIEHINKDAFYGCHMLKKVLFKGKTIEQVKAMEDYPWGIEDESIFKAMP